MKKLLFIAYFMFNLFQLSIGQANCENFKIVSIFDIPPSPQSPGGNYFILLLTVNEDNLNNLDNYADLFFINQLGDSISIPTGPSSTLPIYASDTIPYILQLNSTESNQDFPEDFNGKLVIVHSFQPLCEVSYTNVATAIKSNIDELSFIIFPNPFHNFISVKSILNIMRILIIGADGRNVGEYYPNTNSFELKLDELNVGYYYLKIEFDGGNSSFVRVLKRQEYN